MKLRLLVMTVLASAACGRAQEKPKKADKAETPKVLVFPPGTRKPEKLAEPLERPATGARHPVPEGLGQIVADFFGSLEKGEVDQAYATLTKGSKIAEKPEEVKQLKAKTQEAIEVFGAILGYDLVECRMVGSRLARCTYASQGKVYPLRWRFYFYKPEEVWRLIDMRVDDKLPGMFDEPEDAKNSEVKP